MTARLLDKPGICAYLGEITPSTYDTWRQRGIVPGPVPGTNRYDVRAHDAALDRIGGLLAVTDKPKTSPLDDWKQSHAA